MLVLNNDVCFTYELRKEKGLPYLYLICVYACARARARFIRFHFFLWSTVML